MSEEKNNLIDDQMTDDKSEETMSESGSEPTLTQAEESSPEKNDACEGELIAEEDQNEPALSAPPKKERKKRKAIKISLKTFAFAAVALVLAAVMLTYCICSDILKSKYADGLIKNEQQTNDKPDSETQGMTVASLIDLLQQYIDNNFYGEIDQQKMIDSAIKSYVMATGDPYAAYYTLEELLANNQETAGRMVGIGVNIINSTCEYYEETIKVLHVINVMDNSPALEAGIKIGDYIAFIGTMEQSESIDAVGGYDDALDRLLGEEGTVAEFIVLREVDGELTPIPFSITRKVVETMSVVAKVSETDSSIGIINIRSFDYTTPKQFAKKVEELREAGCEKFVLDLRNNPGGSLVSIRAVLSYFLDEGDVYIQTRDSKGVVTKEAIGVVSYGSGDMAACDVTADMIGLYKDLDFVVIGNENTASAGELFIANIKDYALAPVIGTTTFGKGSMQTTFPLNGGYLGAIKLTTHRYFSGADTELVGYNEIGIKPDVEVDLSEEAKGYNIYVLPENIDDQLIAAIEELGK